MPGCDAQCFVRALFGSEGLDIIDKPVEDIAYGGLAGFEPVIARENAAWDNAAKARNVRELVTEWNDHHVTGAGADDLDEHTGSYSGANASEMSIERAHCHRDARRQPGT